eukprot:3778129-Prymnesium_polylepis.1
MAYPARTADPNLDWPCARIASPAPSRVNQAQANRDQSSQSNHLPHHLSRAQRLAPLWSHAQPSRAQRLPANADP